MLVLSRRPTEKIILKTAHGDRVEISVLEIRPGGKVRLGVEAPQEIEILREELEGRVIETTPSGDVSLEGPEDPDGTDPITDEEIEAVEADIPSAFGVGTEKVFGKFLEKVMEPKAPKPDLCPSCGGHSGDHASYCPKAVFHEEARPQEAYGTHQRSPQEKTPPEDWPMNMGTEGGYALEEWKDAQTSEGSPRCPHCGAVLDVDVREASTMKGAKERVHLHCPECGYGETTKE